MMHAMLAQFLKFAAGGAVGTACHYATLVIWVEVLGGDVVLEDEEHDLAGVLHEELAERAQHGPDVVGAQLAEAVAFFQIYHSVA